MIQPFQKEISEFLYNSIGKKLLGDKKGDDLQQVFFQLIEEYKKREDLTKSKEFDDLYDTFVQLITYYERRSYKLGFMDGVNLFFVLDEDSDKPSISL